MLSVPPVPCQTVCSMLIQEPHWTGLDRAPTIARLANTMRTEVSIAISTTSRPGGLALGIGDELIRVETLDASTPHAAQLITRLSALLEGAQLKPQDLDHAYVSTGPGSFTGLRIGVTVVRTLAQMLGELRCVAVPTAAAVAENAREISWENLGVVMDARYEQVHATLFKRKGTEIVPIGPASVVTAEEFLSHAPRPLLLTGEALKHYSFPGDEIELADESLYCPKPQGVWRVGRKMATEGEFTEPNQLLPIYARRPEAERLWAKRCRTKGANP